MEDEEIPLKKDDLNITMSTSQFEQLEVEPLYTNNSNKKNVPRCPDSLQSCPCRCYLLQKHCSYRRSAVFVTFSTCVILFIYLTVQVGIISNYLTHEPNGAPQPDDSIIVQSFITVRHGPEGKPPTQESFEFLVNSTILSKLFIFTELIERGDGHTAVSHTVPSENVPMYFNISNDKTQLLLYRKQLAIRASNKQDQTLLDDGVSDFLLAELPITSTENGVITILVTSLIEKHFGIPIELDQFATPSLNKIRVVSVKGYPKNINFVTEIKSKASSGGSSSTSSTIRTIISLALLPEKPMISRVADHRIGYFATEYTNVGIHPRNGNTIDDVPSSIGAFDVDQTIHVINKWRLEKDIQTCDDPTKKMGCEPKKPIIYYVDPTVPTIWQKYVKIGIELWQPSFASLGFKNTPRAILPSDKDFPKDYASGDLRYASVSFAISRDYVFSVGPSVTDPRTGEILDADIGFSQEWVHAFSGSIGRDTLSSLSNMNDHHNHHHSKENHRRFRSRHNCNKERLAAFLANTGMSMRALVDAADTNGRVPVEIIGRGLAGVTVHEVGHTLGLRHNFAGSSTISYSTIYDQTKTMNTGSSSSVMDYVGPVIAPTPLKQKSTLVFPDGHTVGAYDRLAIEYGYTSIDDEKPTEQHSTVRSIADKLKTSNLVFATDDDASFNTDPLARRYDMTDDPISYAQDRILVSERMRANVDKYSKWYPNDGSSASSLLLMSALRVQLRAAENAAYHLGGRVLDHHYYNSGVTESNSIVKPVHPGYQEQALSVIRSFLEDEYWMPSSTSVNNMFLDQHVMYLNPYGLGMEYGLDVSLFYKQYEQSINTLLLSVTDPNKLIRIHQTNMMLLRKEIITWSPNQWTPKMGAAKTMSIEDVLRTLSDSIWYGWSYNKWSSRSRWTIINNWVARLSTLYEECIAKPSAYFQVQIDVLTIVKEMTRNLTSAYHENGDGGTNEMYSFVNTTLKNLDKIINPVHN